ncbi:DUF3306 domain-containing protein [Kaustia mangrovi]|uniref:DUF3306 domain-containing protein n=1 Tax=Kaustia mangrovi TaxID=2593653 RepID=A0A7S8HAS9_9HYPH|nr:DUF3306 domain-containing protein [Kaustia mangrovi]QPC41907.1 DUF3306 domain-containing protein [Kaustia mangrovi]
MARDETFIARWSRRKLKEERDEDRDAPVSPDESGTPAEAGTAPDVSGQDGEGTGEALTPEEEAMVRELEEVDIDALTHEDDFTRFLHKKVPAELKRRALRKLWTTDPLFAIRDGLNDYDTDFTDKATVVETLKSAWMPGCGYAPEESEEPEEPEEEAPGAAAASQDDEAVASVDGEERDQAGESSADGAEEEGPEPDPNRRA